MMVVTCFHVKQTAIHTKSPQISMSILQTTSSLLGNFENPPIWVAELSLDLYLSPSIHLRETACGRRALLILPIHSFSALTRLA